MTDQNISKGVRISRFIFFILSSLFVVSIVVQTFLAGMVVFGEESNWDKHKTFVHFFEALPVLMLIFSFTGKLPKGTAWLSIALFALIAVQYATTHIAGAGAIHPVIALVLILLSTFIAKRAFNSYFLSK